MDSDISLEVQNKKFVTSDTHFGHANIIKFNPVTRSQFTDVNHMDQEMIRMWNDTVTSDDDEIYILGDVSFHDAKKTDEILSRLRGRKHLIIGNHDPKLIKEPRVSNHFETIRNYHEIYHDKHRVILFHFPILEWNNAHRGAVHLHGHTHGKVLSIHEYRAMDVAFDATGKIMITLGEAVQNCLKNPSLKHHS